MKISVELSSGIWNWLMLVIQALYGLLVGITHGSLEPFGSQRTSLCAFHHFRFFPVASWWTRVHEEISLLFELRTWEEGSCWNLRKRWAVCASILQFESSKCFKNCFFPKRLCCQTILPEFKHIEFQLKVEVWTEKNQEFSTLWAAKLSDMICCWRPLGTLKFVKSKLLKAPKLNFQNWILTPNFFA